MYWMNLLCSAVEIDKKRCNKFECNPILNVRQWTCKMSDYLYLSILRLIIIPVFHTIFFIIWVILTNLQKIFLLQCNMFLSCSAPCKTFRRYKFNIFQKTIYFCHVTFAWYGSYWPIWFQLKLIVLDTYQIKTQTPNQAFKALKLCALSPTNSGLE